MTKKPHDVDTGDDQELTLEEMDAISGGVGRRRRLDAPNPPNLAPSGPIPCPWTLASGPTPCPIKPKRGPVPCPITPED